MNSLRFGLAQFSDTVLRPGPTHSSHGVIHGPTHSSQGHRQNLRVGPRKRAKAWSRVRLVHAFQLSSLTHKLQHPCRRRKILQPHRLPPHAARNPSPGDTSRSGGHIRRNRQLLPRYPFPGTSAPRRSAPDFSARALPPVASEESRGLHSGFVSDPPGLDSKESASFPPIADRLPVDRFDL